MLRNTTIATLLIAPCVHWTPATAQNIYKCADGYSQQPCVNGSALQAGDDRSAAQKAQADAATRRDARTADAMEKDRLKQEAKAAPAFIAPAKAAEPPARDAKPKKPEVFKASVPAQPGDKAQKKKSAKKEG